MTMSLVEHVIGKHGLCSNGERFAGFCKFHQIVVGGKLFEHSACRKLLKTGNGAVRLP